MTPAVMIEKYIALRNKRDEIKERQAQELAPYLAAMQQLEGELLAHLDTTKLDSVKSDRGTAFKQTATSVTVSNWKECLEFVKRNELWDILEARVAKNATLAVIEDTEKPVPGVKITQAIVLRVRAA